MRPPRCIMTGILFLALLTLAACGGDGLKRVPVEGKLTARGKPVDSAVVGFQPALGTKGEGGIGITDNEGNFFVIGSRQGDKGLVPGEYKVWASRKTDWKTGAPLGVNPKHEIMPKWAESIPPKYTDPGGTSLTVTIPDSGGPLNIDLREGLMGRRPTPGPGKLMPTDPMQKGTGTGPKDGN
jgi:hypothetical protein